jgi:broad specificity phosphatase PhoE
MLVFARMHIFSPSPDTCLAILIRHGATGNNLLNPPRLQGQRSNEGLSATGMTQAEVTARLLAPRPIAACYSSPLLRARQTCEIIARQHTLAVTEVQELIECDVGDWENHTWPEIQRDEPEAYRQFTENPSVFGYRGGENLQQVQDRAMPVIEKLMTRHLGEAIVVVSHNVVNRVVIGHLLGIPMPLRRHIPQDNCAVNVLRSRGGLIRPVSINAVFHLQDAGP